MDSMSILNSAPHHPLSFAHLITVLQQCFIDGIEMGLPHKVGFKLGCKQRFTLFSILSLVNNDCSLMKWPK